MIHVSYTASAISLPRRLPIYMYYLFLLQIMVTFSSYISKECHSVSGVRRWQCGFNIRTELTLQQSCAMHVHTVYFYPGRQ